MKLTVVTTLFKSADTIGEFHRRISEQARKISDDYEIIMVDDGSPDESLEIAKQISRNDPKVCVVELSRNFGHHKAIMAGLDHAQGDYVFLIDVDLEEAPEHLGEFFSLLQGSDDDVIYGYQNRRKGGFIKKHLGEVVWKIIDRLYVIKIPRNQCTVRLMRKEYVDALLLHRERSMVIGGLWVITGFRQAGIAIDKSSREESSYSFVHRVATLIDGVTSFSSSLLTGMVLFGFTVIVCVIVVGIWIVYQSIVHATPAGWASVLLSLWFLSGVIILSVGVVGLYVSKIYIETKNRPYVIVRRVHGKGDGVG